MNLGDVGLILRLLLDICVMWTLIYACIRIIRNNSRTVQIVKGILVLLLFQFLVTALQLKTVSTLLDIVLRWGMIVVLIESAAGNSFHAGKSRNDQYRV